MNESYLVYIDTIHGDTDSSEFNNYQEAEKYFKNLQSKLNYNESVYLEISLTGVIIDSFTKRF